MRYSPRHEQAIASSAFPRANARATAGMMDKNESTQPARRSPPSVIVEPLPHRAPWDNFPDVVIVADQSSVKKHADYEQAKQGNVQDAAPAAKRLSAAMLPAASLDAIGRLPLKGALIVPVHALEGQGFNRIPAAFAELLGEKFNLEIETGIIQVNVVNHTGATGWQRLASPPLFEGPVIANQRYLLIDDFVGQGGTLANLRGHIAHHGGEAVGAVCLTGRADSSKLALTRNTLEGLKRKHGPELESWWIKTCGYEFVCLTESEARYLVRVENADAVRARLAEARSERDG